LLDIHAHERASWTPTRSIPTETLDGPESNRA